jgi:hypothetical protein
MTDKKIQDEVASIERRNFLKLSGAGAFTVAILAGAAGTLWSDEAGRRPRRKSVSARPLLIT